MGNGGSTNSYGTYAILPGPVVVASRPNLKMRLFYGREQTSPDPTHILPHLMLGGYFAYKNPNIIPHLGITHILNVATELEPDDDFYSTLIDSNIIYKKIFINSSIDYQISQHFEEAFQMIDHARLTNGRILVNCKLGVSRSGNFFFTLIYTFLLLTIEF